MISGCAYIRVSQETTIMYSDVKYSILEVPEYPSPLPFA